MPIEQDLLAVHGPHDQGLPAAISAEVRCELLQLLAAERRECRVKFGIDHQRWHRSSLSSLCYAGVTPRHASVAPVRVLLLLGVVGHVAWRVLPGLHRPSVSLPCPSPRRAAPGLAGNGPPHRRLARAVPRPFPVYATGACAREGSPLPRSSQTARQTALHGCLLLRSLPRCREGSLGSVCRVQCSI